jgi:L-alanine-DL-glutamate epimerase-like enolase superfamily enzyme
MAAPVPSGWTVPPASWLSEQLIGLDAADDAALEARLAAIDRGAGRAVRSAVESAVVDVRARGEGRSLATWFAADAATTVAVSGLLGIDRPEVVAGQARALAGEGLRTLKLKAGREPPGQLSARVAAVRAAVGPDVNLRLDFNGALAPEEAPGVLLALRPYGIEYAEQPITPAAGPTAVARLREATGMPIAADEAVADPDAAGDLLAAGAVDVLVVKPARVGGLASARRIADVATEAGVATVLSTAFECGVGIAGAAGLAASVAGERAHGLGTAELLVSDLLAEPIAIDRGRMRVPSGPGLGVQLDEAAVDAFRAP